MDELNGAELSLEQLEAIAGGVIGESEEDVIRLLMKLMKDDGFGIDWTIKNIARYAGDKDTSLANCTPDEVTEYIKTHWSEF